MRPQRKQSARGTRGQGSFMRNFSKPGFWRASCFLNLGNKRGLSLMETFHSLDFLKIPGRQRCWHHGPHKRGVFLLRRRGCGWGRSGDGRREMRHAGRGGFPLPLSESRSQVEANGPGELSAHWHFGLPVGAGRGAAGRSGPLRLLRVEGPCLSETSALALLAVPEEKAVEQRCQRGGYSGSVAVPP